MKSRLWLLGVLSLMLASCDHNSPPSAEADESEVTNENDASHSQDVDRSIAQKVRQNLESDQSLSQDAKNIKVIVMNGDVTLRGSVQSPQEKSIILMKVRQIPDVNNINDRLEINR